MSSIMSQYQNADSIMGFPKQKVVRKTGNVGSSEVRGERVEPLGFQHCLIRQIDQRFKEAISDYRPCFLVVVAKYAVQVPLN
jgi:hypothetical protein